MKSPQRYSLLFATFALLALLALSFTPSASTQVKKPSKGPAKKDQDERRRSIDRTAKRKAEGRESLQSSILIPDNDENEEAEDPDLPPWLAGKIDKEAYLRLRADYVDMLRGRPIDLPFDPREAALQQMEKQEAATHQPPGVSPMVNTTTWTFLGPAPIPLGQTSTSRVPVSGRTISIAVHPTDENTVYVGTAQGGLYKSTNGGANWTRLFEFQLESLAIGAVTIDPVDSNIVYVGTGEPNLSADSFAGRGVYILRNADSPTPVLTGPFRLDGVGNDVFTGRAIGRIVVNPLDNNVIFVCTTSGIGGNPSAAPPNLPPRGIYRSSNAQGGSPTFSQVQITGITTPNDRSTIDLALDPANPNLLIATVVGATSDGGIYRTANALDPTPTFTRTLTLPNGSTNGRAELYLNRNATSVTIYAATGEISSVALGGPACASTTAGMLRRSTDQGLTWSTPLPGSTGFCGGQCFYDMALVVTPDNQTIHLGGAARGGSGSCVVEVMKRSTNGGTSFARNDATLHADEHALAIAPSNPQVVYTGSDGGIWRSTNNGTNWTSLNNADFSATQFQGVALHPYDRFFLMGGTQDNGTNCLAPDGVTWSHCRDGDGGYAIIDDNAQDTTNVLMYHTFFNQTNSQIGFERAASTAAGADGQLTGWTFRGCSGTTTNNGLRCADNVLFYAPMAQGPGNPNTLYFGTDRLYRSTNRGDLMTLVSQGPLVSGTVLTTIAISPQDDNVRIVGLRNGQVFATTTGSSPMTNVTGANFPAGTNAIGRVAIDPNNKFTAYVTFTSFLPPPGQQIFKTTNLNDPTPTWTPASNGIPTVPTTSLVVDPQNSNILYAGTDIGVYQSTDGGSNWAPYGTGLPRVAVFDVKLSNVQRMLRIATHGRGIWEIGVSGQVLPVLHDGGATIIAEGCTPGNGVIDAHEDITVRLGLTNVGPAPTTNLTVTLQATGGVAFPTGPVSYSPIAPNTTGFGDFSFLANVDCGDTITLTFHLQDGAFDLGNITKTFTVGTLVSSPTSVESFDGVTAPALPAGWTTARTGTAPLWVTSTTNSSPPNSAFGGGTTTPGDSRLDSPVIAIPAAPGVGHKPGVQLSFRNSYNTEGGFDGGVLEISINSGLFQDIITAGGTFVSGGYNAVIDPTTDNVLAGRQAWSGNSGGFITTTINLPPASFGQTAQFRWRVGYDTGTSPGGGGLRIDTITLSAVAYTCCEGSCVITCPANISVPNDTGQCGAIVSYSAPTFTGNCGTVTSSPASGTLFPVGTTTVVAKGMRLDGTMDSCSFTVTVNDTTPPVITCPANITKGTDPNVCTAVATFSTTVTDNCPGAAVLCTPPSGTAFPKGVTTVNCTATDASGNTASCSFIVTVNDTQAPSITCPANITQPAATGVCTAVVTYSAPAVGDNCPGVGAPVCTPASGSTFPKGTTTVTCTVKDAVNNQSSCSFTVTVTDTQPPTITCSPNITTNTVNAGDATVAVNFAAPVAADNCPGVVAVCVPPSGSQFPRGTTTVTCTATDTSNNKTSCSFTVRVFDYVIVDDPSGKMLRFISSTGDYDFFDCRKAISLSGRGQVTITSCKTELRDTGPDPRHPDRNLAATGNPCTRVGSATITFGGTTHTLNDPNMSGNNVGCP